jgi:hypothetical protein
LVLHGSDADMKPFPGSAVSPNWGGGNI